jgi:2-iminobutanoate/2-iminopropanoate deaminase
MLHRVHDEASPAPLARYPHAVVANGFVFCSGQGARDPSTGELADGRDIRAQTEACLSNVRRVLEAAGSSFEHLVELQVYLCDMSEFAAMNEVYDAHFRDSGPARTTIGVAALPAGNRIEMRAVALAPAHDGGEAR